MSPSPIVFEPLFMERIWGGRRLETSYGKRLPIGVRIGESWELVDRADYQSVVHNGQFRGLTLNELWRNHRGEIFGHSAPDTPRFPLLFKLLDCQDRLSVQVHPPEEAARRFSGESKTEMWYILDALLDSDIYAGLRAGATREQFDEALKTGHVADLIHRIPSRSGDAYFIPSGRIHALGAGNVIFEVQQNSDTTYRVFDWNRLGLDNKPRELHICESLASIDFKDVEPSPVEAQGETVVGCNYFQVQRWEITGERPTGTADGFAVFCVASGRVTCGGTEYAPGKFFLVPAGADCMLSGEGVVLRTTL